MDSLGLRELEWRTPDLRDAMLHLQIISDVEGVPHSFEAMRRTFAFCQCDFRRTLMQLQLASLNVDNHAETVSASMPPGCCQSSSWPRAVSVANGLGRLGALEPDSQFVDEHGISQEISFKTGMVRTCRMFEDGDGFLDALFNTTWGSSNLLVTDNPAGKKAELERLLEISKLTDAMSHAILLSEVGAHPAPEFLLFLSLICTDFTGTRRHQKVLYRELSVKRHRLHRCWLSAFGRAEKPSRLVCTKEPI
jgi:hypothetical protein